MGIVLIKDPETGDRMLFTELAEKYDLKSTCIAKRYDRGDRGERLVRPVDKKSELF